MSSVNKVRANCALCRTISTIDNSHIFLCPDNANTLNSKLQGLIDFMKQQLISSSRHYISELEFKRHVSDKLFTPILERHNPLHLMINQLIPVSLYESVIHFVHTQKSTIKLCFSIMEYVYNHITRKIWSLHTNALADLEKEYHISKKKKRTSRHRNYTNPTDSIINIPNTTYDASQQFSRMPYLSRSDRIGDNIALKAKNIC